MTECKPIEAIRMLTAMSKMEVRELSERLALVNMICRVLEGDTEKDFADEILAKSGITVTWEELGEANG